MLKTVSPDFAGADQDIETRRAVSPTPASSDGASASAKTRRSKGPFWTLSAAIGKIEVRHDMPSYPTISAATLPHSHSIVSQLYRKYSEILTARR